MRKDKLNRQEAFAQAINDTISSGEPRTTCSFEEYRWAMRKQSQWGELLNISERTLRTLAKTLPIVSTKTKFGSCPPIVLYRVGSAPHQSHRVVAQMMQRAFKQKYSGWKYRSKDFGCLCGLAKIWPEGTQVEILRTVMNDMAAFKTRVKMIDEDSDFDIRFYEYVCIPLLRKFPDIGLEMYVMRLQKEGKQPPPSIKALSPSLWPKTQCIKA